MVNNCLSIAIFDLDNTILDGDCELLWSRYLANQNLVDSAYLERINRFFVDYDNGTIDYPAYVRHLLLPFKGLARTYVQSIVEPYIESLRTLIRPALAARLAIHRSADDVILLASSSIDILIEPIARMLGIDNVVCTIAEFENEVVTGNYVGDLAFGHSKVNKVKAWIDEHQLSLDGSWGYSDSQNDLPLLQFVQNPVAVFPDDRLRKTSIANGWIIIDGIG